MHINLFKIILIVFLFTAFSCGNHKLTLNKVLSKQLPPIEKGILNFTFLPYSQIIINEDTAKVKTIKIEKGDKLILKFEFIKKSVKNIADSGYREVLYLEIPNNKKSINLTDLKNTDIKIWFARFCFCRDYIGFYKITEGKLQIDISAKTLKIKSEIKFNNLPQVLNFIDQKISLKKNN